MRIGQRAIGVRNFSVEQTERCGQRGGAGRFAGFHDLVVNAEADAVNGIHQEAVLSYAEPRKYRPLRENARMVRKTMKMFVAVLIAAFALSSMAEAAAPKKTRHRTKHSSRVSSGAVATTGTKPAEKKKTAKKHAKANAAAKPGTKKSSTKRPPPTKPR